MTARDASVSGIDRSIKITHRKSPSPNSASNGRQVVYSGPSAVVPVGKQADGSDIIPLEQLRNVSPRRLLSQGYDPSIREIYLSNDDFVIAFSMTRDEFL